MNNFLSDNDLQADTPPIALGLDDVGVTNLVRGVLLNGAPTTAQIDISCNLGNSARGVHMSRFHEAIDQALMLLGDERSDLPSLEVFAVVAAARAVDLQQVSQAIVTVSAQLACPTVTPASNRRSIDPIKLTARALVDHSAADQPRSTVSLTAEVVGITACPCAQDLVRTSSAKRLLDAGFSLEQVETVFQNVPVATHNQRSTGSLTVELPGDGAVTAIADPFALSDLVRSAMSGQVHELLKRDDELAVVEAAHKNPRFVEDCVRTMLHNAAQHPTLLSELPLNAVLVAHQTNHESIHAHDVSASRRITVGALRAELGLEPEAAGAGQALG